MSGFRWTTKEVEAALGKEFQVPYTEFSNVSTDTRKIAAGSLFVALRGESFDGHTFLARAAEVGATGAVVSHRPEGAPGGLVYFTVDDTLHALGRLGHYRRTRLPHDVPVVAVAGSNGKTTTKDLLRAVLAPLQDVHATEGNLNNQVGVPLTLLALPADHDPKAVVVEVGTNEPGEIDLLGAIVEPDLAVITSIGEEHLEGLGSVAGVLDEETAILRHLRPGGVAIVAEEPSELPERTAEIVGGMRMRVAGFDEQADLHPDGGRRGVEVLPGGATRWRFRGEAIDLPLPGMHNVSNALIALGVAAELGVEVRGSAEAIARMPVPKMRGEWRQVGSLQVLADCYNANPPSTRAALELLASLPAQGAKVAVIGTMREMGEQAAELHRSIGALAVEKLGKGIDRIVATGDFVPALAGLGDGRVIAVEDPLEAYAALRPLLNGNETVLLKGSRGVALERLLPLLERDFAGVPEVPAPSTAH